MPLLVVAALLLPLALVRWRLASTLNINWDEFYFLSRIHTWVRGELTEKLLTFHVHLFSWIGRVSAQEIDQVLALREVMLAFGLLAAASTAVIGWRLMGSDCPARSLPCSPGNRCPWCSTMARARAMTRSSSPRFWQLRRCSAQTAPVVAGPE